MQNSLFEYLERSAKIAADKVAYIFLDEQGEEQENISYSALHQKVIVLAEKLQKSNYSGARAILVYPQGIDFIVAFLACLKAGVIAIPIPALDASLKERLVSRISNIIVDAEVELVLTTSNTRNVLYESVSELNKRVSWFTATESIHSNDTNIANVNKTSPIAYLQYTSGSTSKPKGVIIEHDTLIKHLAAIRCSCAYNTQSISVSWMPHFHDYGLVEGLLLPLFNETLCVFMAPSTFIKRPAVWFEIISRYKATHSHAPSFAHELCVNKLKNFDDYDIDLSSWQVAALGAEPIKPEILQNFYEKFSPFGFSKTALTPAYGLAENTLVATIKQPYTVSKTLRLCRSSLGENVVQLVDSKESNAYKDIVSCGKPIKNTSVYIVDPITKKQCEPSCIGEVWLASEGVASGYWNNTSANNDTFKASLAEQGDEERHFLRTGDLGFLHDEELYITGRLKDVIIINGVNYWPQDIEWAVEKSHDSIKKGGGCAAFSVDIKGVEQLVVACEVTCSNVGAIEIYRCGIEAVFALCGLPVYDFVIVPKGVILKTSSGKLQRSACSQSYIDDSLRFIWKKQALGAEYSPTAPSEVKAGVALSESQKVAAWISDRILHFSTMITSIPSPDDVLAELPLDSLDYLSLACDIEAHYKVKLALSEFVVNQRTIAGLAEQILAHNGGDETSKSSLVLLQKNGEKLPFFCVHPAGGNVVGYTALAHAFKGVRPFYGIQSQGLVEGTNPIQSFEEMAEFYIEEIKSVQPNGPYFLGGMCLGGIIAFEMAQQLIRSGEKIGFLGLIDPRNPPSLLREIEKAELDPDYVSALFSNEHLEKIKVIKQESESKPSPSIPQSILPTEPLMKKVWDNNAMARENYIPKVFSEDISFFWADKTEGPLGFYHNPEVCWFVLTTGSVDVHRLGINHFQMLAKPHLNKLASLLLTQMENAENGAATSEVKD